MRIVHAKVDRGFTIIPDRVLTDTRLSFRARGVLAYVLSRPDGWETSAERLAAGAQEGRDAVRTALRELERVGYLRRTRVQDDRGRWSTVQVVTDTPAPDAAVGAGAEVPGPSAPTTDSQPSVAQPSVSQASLARTETKTETQARRARVSTAELLTRAGLDEAERAAFVEDLRRGGVRSPSALVSALARDGGLEDRIAEFRAGNRVLSRMEQNKAVVLRLMQEDLAEGRAPEWAQIEMVGAAG